MESACMHIVTYKPAKGPGRSRTVSIKNPDYVPFKEHKEADPRSRRTFTTKDFATRIGIDARVCQAKWSSLHDG